MENNVRIVCTLMILVFLGVSTYFDFRWKSIPIWVQGMGVIFLCTSIIIEGQKLNWNHIFSLMPGMFLLTLSFVTRENIGYGDGISVLILGGMIGVKNCIWVLCISLMMMSFVGIVLMVTKRANRKTRIPYIPFMFVAESFLLMGTKL